jgi:hypothetical protein
VGKQVIGELSNTFWCFFQFDFLLGFYCESRLRIGVVEQSGSLGDCGGWRCRMEKGR